MVRIVDQVLFNSSGILRSAWDLPERIRIKDVAGSKYPLLA